MITFFNTFSIPSWAVCAIEYGDYSGLSDDEIRQIEDFFEDFPCDKFTIQWGEDEYFSNSPAFGLPCTCIDAEFYEHQTVGA